MASRKLEDCHPLLIAAYTAAKAEWTAKFPNGPAVIITQTYRSVAEQNALYAQGRTKPGQIVTNARGLQSAHNYLPSYALDVAFDKGGGVLDWSDKWFKLFAPLMTKHAGIEWGGAWRSFTDMPHFDVINWKILAKNK